MDEFALIAKHFTRPTQQALLGVGDDAALWPLDAQRALAITSDMLLQGRHFLPHTDPHALGHKALAVNVSDLAAMGAQPRGYTLALALPEARVGLLPCAGGTQRLAQLVGEGWAKRMILCGERIGAQQAQTLGLVEEVVPTGEALATATALAAKVGNQSPSSVAACKRLIHSARNIAIADGLVAERDEFVALFSTEDQQEGTNAFLEKREPEWKNQ